MLELALGVGQEEVQRLVYVQEEPALEIALPQVFEQPALGSLQRGKLANVEALAAHIARRQRAAPEAALGPDYQELVTEFQPLFTWATACWDYLLSTEGCRFVPRGPINRYGIRGDYRVVTDKDYSRLVHAIFRRCVLEFDQEPMVPTLSQWLRGRFWPLVLEAYRQLENPPDPRQRILTPYSYLRCVPYQFLNDVHQDLVYATTRRLPQREFQAIDAYFFHFYTEEASAASLSCAAEELRGVLRQSLTKLLIHHRLVYCLLRQIERY
ncbi:MAG: hypothetical protein HY598_02910 [Candidatus Omnitrophica bacterium]|nr:hypothetical protein [Candidatus Omnitrophota bacterium]